MTAPHTVALQFTTDEMLSLVQAAEADGSTIGPWARGIILRRARLRRVHAAHPASPAVPRGCSCVIPGTGVDFGELDPACPTHAAGVTS